jgi:hypothetical protein
MPTVVHYDPATGLYVNPETGMASTDPHGQQPANPALGAQASRNLGISNQLLAQLGPNAQQYQTAQAGQTAAATSLGGVIAGTSPTASGTSLAQGLSQAQQAAQSQASGATGTNAALARMTAIQTGGDLSAATNEAGAVARANEVTGARGLQAQILGQQAGEAAGMYGTNLSGGLTASGQAVGAEGTAEQIQAQKDAATKQLIANLVAGGGSALAMGATRGGGAVPTA